MTNPDTGITPEEREVQRRLARGDIPIRVGNRVEWITRHQLVRKMRDDFQDRHITTISEDDDDY